jgi:hypothetical protein
MVNVMVIGIHRVLFMLGFQALSRIREGKFLMLLDLPDFDVFMRR